MGYTSSAMLTYTLVPDLVLVRNASGSFYLPDDSGYTTPVAVQLLDGTSVLTVGSNDQGMIPPLNLPAPLMIWKSGEYLVPIQTLGGVIEVVQAAAAAAAAAADDAAEARALMTESTTDQIDAYLGGVLAGKADLDEDGKVLAAQLPDGLGIVDASGEVKGAIRLAGDLGGTAASPTVPGLSTKANDNAVVKLAGAQTVGGKKTFTESPVVPDSSFTPAKIAATGTRTATTFLAGDGMWKVLSDLANLPPGATFQVSYDGTNWRYAGAIVTARPSSRTDLVMQCVNATNATVPAWAIAGDQLLRVG